MYRFLTNVFMFYFSYLDKVETVETKGITTKAFNDRLEFIVLGLKEVESRLAGTDEDDGESDSD